MRIAWFLALMATHPAWAQATTPLRSSPAVSSGDVLQWLFALVAVLGVFLTMVWIMRKSGNWNWMSKQPLQVVASLSLGVRERLVVVNVGEKQLLLGVTSGRIDKLLELEGEQRIAAPMANGSPVSFAQQLQQVLNGRNHD